MQDGQKSALKDVLNSLADGDPKQASLLLERPADAQDEEPGQHGLLLDLSLSRTQNLARCDQSGPWARNLFLALTASDQSRLLDGDAAALHLGRVSQEDKAAGSFGSVLLFRTRLIALIAANDYPDAALTPAEHRIIFLLLAGYDLREMALLDAVGYETRRSQFKVLAAKLRAPRQLDVIRHFLGRAIALLAEGGAGAEARNTTFFTETSDRQLGELRPFILSGPEGRELRAVEIGARRGEPVMVLHPQAFPILSATESAAFTAFGLRSIWPIRPGALADHRRHLAPQKHLERCLADACALHEALCGEPVPLVGLLSGAPFAAELARFAPERFSRLILVGCCYRPTTGGIGAGALRRGLYWMARSSPGLIDVALRLLSGRIADPAAYRRTVRHHYRDSPADLAVIDRAIRERLLDRMLRRYLSSIASIRNDFLIQADYDWSCLAELPMPLHFIHGVQDPVHPIAEIRALVASLPDAGLDEIDRAGQLLMFEHMVEAVRLLALQVHPEIPRDPFEPDLLPLTGRQKRKS